MSWVGLTTGEPSAAESKFWVESISSRASFWAAVESGQVSAGLEEMRRGLAAYRATGLVLVLPYLLGLLAEAHGRQGRGTDALRLLGAGSEAEALRVFQEVAELVLRRPLKPEAIRGLVGMLGFQVEFFTGREFGLRVRGEGIALLNRTREVLQAIADLAAPAAS